MSRVLIVDNDAALAEVLAEVVAGRMPGVEAHACDSGAAALARIADTEYDAVAPTSRCRAWTASSSWPRFGRDGRTCRR